MWNHYEFIYFGGPRIINLQRLELFSGLHSASFKELYQTFKVSSCDYTISKSGDNNITWGPQTLDFENTRFFYILRMCCTAIAPFRSSPRLAVACWLSCCDPPPRAPPPSPRPGSRCPWRPPGRRRTNRCWCWSRCTCIAASFIWNNKSQPRHLIFLSAVSAAAWPSSVDTGAGAAPSTDTVTSGLGTGAATLVSWAGPSPDITKPVSIWGSRSSRGMDVFLSFFGGCFASSAALNIDRYGLKVYKMLEDVLHGCCQLHQPPPSLPRQFQILPPPSGLFATQNLLFHSLFWVEQEWVPET